MTLKNRPCLRVSVFAFLSFRFHGAFPEGRMDYFVSEKFLMAGLIAPGELNFEHRLASGQVNLFRVLMFEGFYGLAFCSVRGSEVC